MHIDVLVELQVKGINKTFTYNVPSNLIKDIEIGKRVLVPFGNRKLEGFIVNINNNEIDYDIKDIIEVIDEYPVLNSELLSIGKYMEKKYLCSLISAYQVMLPKALKASSNTKINKKYITYLTLIDTTYIGKTNTQKEILDLFKINEYILKKQANMISNSSVKTLINKKIIKEIKEETYRLDNKNEIKKRDIKYTDEQLNAINTVKLNEFNTYLLHGVTGSGKTEVYINLINKVIKEGKEAIFLVPEISLTAQLINIFRNNFGSIAILHSRLSDSERYDEYRKILNKEVKIAIGARSCIFAPFENLGIIIIDEEHTETYKQENNPRYHAIDIALYRGKKRNIPVILGSATPSLESYTRAKLNVYKLIEMKNRINKLLPTIELVDMKNEIKKGNKYFSSILINKIKETVEKKEQVIIFLNRRGYSTIITCHNCGYIDKCTLCDIPLTYHKKSDINKCHYCNYTKKRLSKCPSCNSSDISSLGIGCEKLEEEVKKLFPSSNVVRMDLDTTSTKNAHERIINDFKDLKYDILIGTQMIVKGLDFPNVTLVGVINGDNTLNMPDFRSSEKTFGILSQVAGRSGRSKKGSVIIQGFNIDHYSIKRVCENDYIGFYNDEIEIRRKLIYPPFCSICLIKIKGSIYDEVVLESNKIINYLTSNLSNKILGPTMDNRINNIYTMHIIIKYKNINEIYDNLLFIKNKYITNKKINIEIDINPLRT